MRTNTAFAFLLFPLLMGCPPKEEDPQLLPACSDRQPLTDDMFVGGLVLEAGSCWRVEQNLNLSDGTVTAEEGVSIWFATDIGASIASGGRLALSGTETNPILLTTDDPLVTWRGIQLNSSQGSDNLWTHVEIENAGSDNWTGAAYSGAAVYLSGDSTLDMDSVTIRNSQSHGLVAFEDVALSFVDGTFERNVTPAFLHVGVVGALGSETAFVDNAESWVSVAFGNNDAITEPTTWHALDVPYRVQTRFFVDSDWTIAPGAIIEVEQDVSIHLAPTGALFAEGTETEPIVFRGASAGTRGYWIGIALESGGTDDPVSYGAIFDHVQIEDAGASAWNGNADSISAVYMSTTSAASFTNTTFTNSGRYGLYATNNARIDGFADNVFVDNARVMRLHANRVGELTGTSSYTGNDDDRVHVGFGNNDVVSRDASWKDLGVPYELSDRFFIGAALNIEAGTVFQAAQDVGIIVEEEGSIRGHGTSAQPVVFRGVNPVDTGYWKGIQIQSNSPENQFSGLELLHAGSDAWYGGDDAEASIYLAEGATLALTDSLIGLGNSYGVIRGTDAILSCSGVDLTDTAGVYSWATDASTPGC